MKSIIVATALLAGSSLMGAESAQLDGAKLYKHHCAVCHGEKGTESPKKGIPAIAGRDATTLALAIRAYRDQDKNIGTYTMHKNSEVMKDETRMLSDQHISAIAKYISTLK